MASRRLRKAGGNDDDEEKSDDDAFASASGSEGSAKSDAGDDEVKKDKAVTKEFEIHSGNNSPPSGPAAEPDKTDGEWKPKMRSKKTTADSENVENKDAGENEEDEHSDEKKGKKEEPVEKDPSATAPRDGRYFLHDDRGKDEEAEGGGHEEDKEEDGKEGKGKGKGKERDISADAAGPWLHDKFHELMESMPAKPKTRQSAEKWDDNKSERWEAKPKAEKWTKKDDQWSSKAEKWEEESWEEGWQKPAKGKSRGKDRRQDDWNENDRWGGKSDNGWGSSANDGWNSQSQSGGYREKASSKENSWSNDRGGGGGGRDDRSGGHDDRGGRGKDSWQGGRDAGGRDGGRKSWEASGDKSSKSWDSWGKNNDSQSQSKPTRYSQMTF